MIPALHSCIAFSDMHVQEPLDSLITLFFLWRPLLFFVSSYLITRDPNHRCDNFKLWAGIRTDRELTEASHVSPRPTSCSSRIRCVLPYSTTLSHSVLDSP